MVTYLNPKQFTVHIVDEQNKPIMDVSFSTLQKTDHDIIGNVLGEGVHETLKVIRDTFIMQLSSNTANKFDNIFVNEDGTYLMRLQGDILSIARKNRDKNIQTLTVREKTFDVDISGLAIVGRHTHIGNHNFDNSELQRGIQIEKEHTDDIALATEIAKDHLAEIPDYYTRLELMERKDFWSLVKK